MERLSTASGLVRVLRKAHLEKFSLETWYNLEWMSWKTQEEVHHFIHAKEINPGLCFHCSAHDLNGKLASVLK